MFVSTYTGQLIISVCPAKVIKINCNSKSTSKFIITNDDICIKAVYNDGFCRRKSRIKCASCENMTYAICKFEIKYLYLQ